MIPFNRIVPAPADRDMLSPNHGPRTGKPIRLVILHATADGGNEHGAEVWMRNPKSQVSAHLHIRRDGSVTRLVPDARRAWHAGRSEWPGVVDVNSESLGWEIANRNDGREPYTDAQYRTVAHLLRHYLPQGLQRSDVLGHAMIAPERKTDPLGWEWDRMWALYDRTPEVSESAPVQEPPNLEKIIAPRPEHVDEVARVRGFSAEQVRPGLVVVEVILRAMQRAGVKGAKTIADGLSAWLQATA